MIVWIVLIIVAILILICVCWTKKKEPFDEAIDPIPSNFNEALSKHVNDIRQYMVDHPRTLSWYKMDANFRNLTGETFFPKSCTAIYDDNFFLHIHNNCGNLGRAIIDYKNPVMANVLMDSIKENIPLAGVYKWIDGNTKYIAVFPLRKTLDSRMLYLVYIMYLDVNSC